LLVNVGTALGLAALVFVMERHFTVTVARETDAVRREVREEFDRRADALETRINELAGRTRAEAQRRDSASDAIIERAADVSSRAAIANALAVAYKLHALDGIGLTVPASQTPTGLRLNFSWGSETAETRWDGDREWEAPKLTVNNDGRMPPRGGRLVMKVVWKESDSAEAVGANVRDALIRVGEYAGEDSFDWQYTLVSLVEGLRRAVASQRRDPGVPNLHGKLIEMASRSIVFTTAGIETADGELLVPSKAFPRPDFGRGLQRVGDRERWRPDHRPESLVNDDEWDWLITRGLEIYGFEDFRPAVGIPSFLPCTELIEPPAQP